MVVEVSYQQGLALIGKPLLRRIGSHSRRALINRCFADDN